MGDAINILPYVKQTDFVGPIEAAMRLHEARENEKTQRMFAQNTMHRQSAQDLREQRDFEERQRETKRKEGIENAAALEHASNLLMQGQRGVGPAQAELEAHGFTGFHPLLATTGVAAPSAPAGDAVDQFLASQGPSASVASSPPEPAGPPMAPPPGIGPPGGGGPPMPGGAPLEGPEATPEMEEARPFMAPPPAGPAPGGQPSLELENLMRAAAPGQAAPTPGNSPAPAVPLPLLYEAMLGGHTYQLGGGAPTGTGLGEKYDDLFHRLVSSGMSTPDEAKKFVAGVYAEDNKSSNRASVADVTNEQRERLREEFAREFGLTGEQRQHNIDVAEEGRNRRAAEGNAARITAAGMSAGLRREGMDEKKQEKEDQTAVRDEQGAVIGHVPTGRGGAQGFATRDADYARAIDQLQALADDIRTHGNRVAPGASSKRRDTLYNDAAIGVATVSPLGKTNESVELEKGSIGASGVPSLRHPMDVAMGANLEAVENKIRQMKKQREDYRKQTLIPVKPGEKGATSGNGDLDALEAWSAGLRKK